MPLNEQEMDLLNQKVQARLGQNVSVSGQPQPVAPGQFSPDIASLMGGIPDVGADIGSINAGGVSIDLPKSREQVGRDLAVRKAERQVDIQNRPPSAFAEKTEFSFGAVDRIVDKLENTFNEIQTIERGPGARISGAIRVGKAALGVDPKITTYAGIRRAVLAQLAKTVSGESGRLTDQDVARVAKAVPSVFSTREEARMQFGIMRAIIDDVIQTSVNRGRLDAGLEPQFRDTQDSSGKQLMVDSVTGRAAWVFPDGSFKLIPIKGE